jgi:hypothetical protein
MTIERFSRDEDFVATLAGNACQTEGDTEGDLQSVPVAVTGRVVWPSAGCDAEMPDPMPSFIGSYRVAEEPGVCQDVYEGANISASYAQICAMGGGAIQCSEDPCPLEDRLGSCDGRSEGAQASLRGLVQHYYRGFDADPADLRMACELQGGTWIPSS